MIMSDENQKIISQSVGSTRLLGVAPGLSDSTVMYSRVSSQKWKRFFNHNYNPNTTCDYCKLRGHVQRHCYKLIGYPPGHRKNNDQQGSEVKVNEYNRYKQRKLVVGPRAHNAIIDELGHNQVFEQVDYSATLQQHT